MLPAAVINCIYDNQSLVFVCIKTSKVIRPEYWLKKRWNLLHYVIIPKIAPKNNRVRFALLGENRYNSS